MRTAALAFLPLLLLAGCSAPGDSSTAIAGTSWRFTAIDGEPPLSEQAHLDFQKKSLGASVGCNSMDGDWRVEDNRLIAGPLTQTEMYCATLWDQEKALNALLTSAPVIVVVGNRMTLKSHGRSAELHKEI